MGTVKAGLWVLGISLAFIFFFQNYEELTHPVSIGINFYFWRGAITPIPLGILLVLFFLFGFAVSSAYSVYDRMMMKRELKEIKSSAGTRSYSEASEDS